MRRYLKILIVFAVFCFAGNTLLAQNFTAKGIIFRKSSTSRVSQALINDLNTKTVMMTDDLGMFTINTWIGDTLLVTKKDYTPFKMVVADKNDLSISLQPVVELNQVTVKGESKKQELNDVMKQYKKDGIFNDGKSLPFWEAVNSPITEFYNLFAKGPANARRFAAYSKDEREASAAVNLFKFYELLFRYSMQKFLFGDEVIVRAFLFIPARFARSRRNRKL